MLKRAVFRVLGAVIFLGVFAACEIGLGESVDTEPPTLTVLSPETGSVLRGSININGTWSDDQGLSKVKVNIVNVNKEATVISSAATIGSDKTWNYTLYTQTSTDVPEGSTVLPDGKYEAKITAYDNAGHSSGEASRTFEIDGTAPLVALSKPASIDGASPSTYGRNVKIKGLISDDHTVPSIKVSVYKSTTDSNGKIVRGDEIPLSKSEFTDFDPSDTSVTIAQYYTPDERGEDLAKLSDAEKALFNNYQAIYGDETQSDGWDTTKKFFADVAATDKAGNTNTITFLKTNMLKLVELICGQALEMADLKNILNGSYSGNLDAEKISSIKSILSGTYDASSDYPDYKNYFADSTNSLAFSVNSNANPKYQISGNYTYTSSTAEEAFGTSEKTGSLTIKVDAGLDGTEFKPNTLSVVITKLTDTNQLSTNSADTITLTAANIYDTTGAIETNSTTTDSGTYSIRLSDIETFLEATKCYDVKVLGSDIDGNKFVAYNDNNYGFMCQVTSTPATVSCEKNKTYVKASELQLSNNDKLTVNIGSDDVGAFIELKAYVKFYDNAIKTSLPNSEFGFGDTTEPKPYFEKTLKDSKNYSVDIPLGFASHSLTDVYNCTVAVYLRVKKENASTTTATYYLYADNAAPNVSFSNGELKTTADKIYVFENGSSYVSGDSTVKGTGYYDSTTGNYTVSGKWDDVLSSVTGSGVNALYYSYDENPVIGQGNWKEIYNAGAGTGVQTVNNMWSQELPVDSQGNRKISFYAVDAVGNKTDVITFDEVVFDFGAPTLKYESSVNDEGKTVLTFTGTDTYGVKDITVVVKKDGNETTEGYTSATSGDSSKLIHTLTFENGLNGVYTISASVTDKAGRTAKLENVDTEAPTITNNNITDNSAADSNLYAAYKTDPEAADTEYAEYYYINPTHGDFTLKGVASDDTGVTSVALTITAKTLKDANEKLLTVSPENAGNTNKYSFTFDLSSWSADTGVDAVLTVRDLAGNITTQKYKIIFDTVAPAGVHSIDSNGKDLFFRLGEQNNDDIDSTSTNPKWNNGNDGQNETVKVDEDVGGKYSSTTYGNSESITIRGTFKDKLNSSSTDEREGSGIARIYYMVTQTTPTPSSVSGFKTNYRTYNYFTPIVATTLKTVEQQAKRRVFYEDTENSGTLYSAASSGQAKYNTAVTPESSITVTSGNTTKTKYYTTITSTFKASLQGFVANSQNYLYLAAVDNVGNVEVDTARLYDSSESSGYKDYGYYLINIDTIVPEVTSDQTDILYSNGTGSITITGTASDSGSGISSVEVYATVSGASVPFDVTYPVIEDGNKTNKWSATIDDASQLGSSGNVTITVKATDNASNSKSITAATIAIDKTGPEVIINSVSNAGSENGVPLVNSTVTITGTANDSLSGINSSEALNLYYTTNLNASKPTSESDITDDTSNVATKWVKYTPADGFGGSQANPWEFKLDSKTLSDNTPILFCISAKDSVGNVGYSDTYKVKVSQDSDRPVITFSNLTLKGTADDGSTGSMNKDCKVWATTNTLYGTIKDDDGISALYVVATDGTEPATSKWNSASNIYSNGAWEYTASEGESVLWFKVVDTENGESNPFISSISSTLTTETNSDSTLLYTPKLRDKKTDDNEKINCYGYKSVAASTETSQGLKTAVYVQVDTKDPEIYQTTWFTQDVTVVNKLKAASASPTELKAIMDNPAGYNWNPLSKLSGVYIGGPGSKIYIMYKSTDKNGIKQTVETFGDVQGTKIVYVGSSNVLGTEEITYSLHEVTEESPLNAPYSTNDLYFTQVVSFNLSGITSSNSVKMTLAVTDRANRTYERNSYFAVDNDAPELEYRNRSDGDSVYGSLSVSVTGRTTETRSSISKLYFGVSKDENTVPSGINATDATELDLTKWIDFTDYVNTASWSITFDGESNTNASESTTYHASLLNTYMDTLYESGTTTNYDSKPLYIWVYAVDSLKNTSDSAPERLKLDVLTQGDKPSVSITYPASDVTIGGTIRLAGTTEINTDSVQAVWLQIDPSYDENDGFNENWATELAALINGKSVGYSIVTESGSNVSASSSTPGSTLKAGILAAGSVSSWNLAINTIGEYTQIENGKDENGTTLYKNRVVAVRACAVSTTNHKLSNYDNFVYFTVDPDSPQFGGYNGAENYLLVSADGKKTQKYTSGMWVSGLWYLKGSITHSAGIQTLAKVISKTESSNLVVDGNAITSFSDGTEITSYETTSGGQIHKGFNFKIPVGSSTADAVGKTSFTLNAVDKSESHNTANLSVSINYDNKAPSPLTAKTTTNLSATGNTFKQSNKTFTLSGTVVEGGTESGFARNAFYFTRDITESGTTTRYFIDPMVAKGDTKKANFVNLGTVADNTFTAENGIVYSSVDGLYWRISSGASMANTNQLTVTSLPENVRVGGLCKIKEVIYRIKAVSGTTLTIDGEFESESDLTVYFALAQVIDNTVLESGTTKVFGDAWESLSNDDDDWMVEGITQNGTNYTWTGSINSKNIYDGPVTLHFSYSDVAGNIATASYSGKVANNAPRLAGVTIATDYNGDGDKEDDGEQRSYWVGSSRTTSTNVATDVAEEITVCAANNGAYMTVKDSTEIRAEVVGGNGKLYYSYNIGTTLGASGNIKGNVSTEILEGNYDYDTTSDDSYMMNGEYIRSRTATIAISASDFDNYLNAGTGDGSENTHYIANSTATAPTWFQYVIWDETDGTTKFTDSQHATMNIALAVKVHDEEDPSAIITPFYWNSNSDNSLYGKSTANGHIELAGDLPSAFKTGGTGVNDRDPKVSGKIVITGYAYDNIRLGSLKVSISKSSVLSSATPVAVYNNGTWYDSSSTTVPDGISVTKGTITDNGWSFTVSSAASDGAYNNEEGHRVKWTLSYDTEKITDVADTDVVVTVQAVDKVSKTGDGTAQMDVVPYIAGVKTSLSSLKKSNSSVYDRTALGHYGVSDSETIYLYGFNLSGGTLKDSASATASLTKVTASSQAWYSSSAVPVGSVYSVGSISGFKSGKVHVTVNSVDSLNNDNNNSSSGDYATTTSNSSGSYAVYSNYYNRQPNNDSNNLLTDDVELDIWQFKDAGIAQTSGYITEPIMKVNPQNGMLNFGFNSGPANYCMAYGQKNSYQTWVGNYARFSTCGFTVDENGETHGITVGLDTNPGDSGSAGRLAYMTSLWGRGELSTTGNYEGMHESRIDNIGAPAGTYNGTTFSGYVFLEDRFASPSLVTAVHGNDTYVYLAYYDDLNGEIRFKWGNLSNASPGAYTDRGYTFDQFADQMKWNLAYNSHKAFNSNTKPEYFSTIASSSTTAKAGNYLSIDVIKGSTKADNESGYDDVIVATWYDASSSSWYYSYKKTPCNDNDMATNPTANPADGNWRTPILLKSNAGENCQIAVDKKGGIHIAAYDASNADLVYAYLSSYTDSSPQVVTVDSYAFTGTNIRLDTVVSDDGKYIIPYIGYYMSSTQKPKMAGLREVISASSDADTREAVTIPAGVDDSDATTAKWENGIIPTTSRYADNYGYSYVNVGLWKDSTTGKAKKMTGTDVAYTNVSGLTNENTSTTYGNDTKNPVLAYATRDGTRGHLETAQLK